MTCVNAAHLVRLIEVIDTIKEPAWTGTAQDTLSPYPRRNTMQFNSFFRSLLAAYACGASGSSAGECA